MKKLIEVITLDKDGDATTSREFDSIKEAKSFVKDTALSAAYWDRYAESEGWGQRNIETIQLTVDGEVRFDWFPEFQPSGIYA